MNAFSIRTTPAVIEFIWRGTAKAEVQNINSPEKSEQLINKAEKKFWKNFHHRLKVLMDNSNP